MVFQYLEEESKLLQYALQKYKRELQAMETTFQVNSELADKELTEEERSVVTLVIIHKRHTKDREFWGYIVGFVVEKIDFKSRTFWKFMLL